LQLTKNRFAFNPDFKMKSRTQVFSTFRCSLERAFKIPMLGDATKIHTGYGFIPAITHFTEDDTWGIPDGHRLAHINRSVLYSKGELAKDIILKRENNKYWKWEVNNFKQWRLGFKKFQGEWFVKDLKNGTIEIIYVYTLYTGNVLFYPFHWLFAKTIWNKYMNHLIHNIKFLAESNAPFIYN
jgi:hypothetical protein